MTRLEMKKSACDVAFASATQNLAAADAAIAAKAGELQLPDPQYQQFRNDALFFRQPFATANQADQLESAQAKAKAANQAAAAKPAAGK